MPTLANMFYSADLGDIVLLQQGSSRKDTLNLGFHASLTISKADVKCLT